jgi:hypothetical protein
MWADGQAHMTKLVTLRNFINAPKAAHFAHTVY